MSRRTFAKSGLVTTPLLRYRATTQAYETGPVSGRLRGAHSRDVSRQCRGEHNAQNREIVAYSDYRLQARHRHKPRRKFGVNQIRIRRTIAAQKELTLSRKVIRDAPHINVGVAQRG
jgi:hypothetical protein